MTFFTAPFLYKIFQKNNTIISIILFMHVVICMQVIRMNMYSWIDSIIKLQTKKAMPILSFPGVQFCDVTVNDLVKNSFLQAKVMSIVAQRINSLASVSMMDLSVEAEAFGSRVCFTDNEIPTIVGAIVSTEEEAMKLKIPVAGDGRTKTYLDAISLACKDIKDRPVFAGVIGPFSLAGRLMEVTEAMVNCYAEPEMVHIVLEKATDFLINYINAYKSAGANGVVMAEPLAGLLSPELSAEFSSAYVKKIVDATQSEDFIVIYHNCGSNITKMIDSVVSTGCKAYHFGDGVNMRDVLSMMPPDVVVMGNVSPAHQFKNGTIDSIKAETIQILNECSNYSNFVISSGCDIPPDASWDNIYAFFDAVDKFYAKN